jgi:hypothetical protein
MRLIAVDEWPSSMYSFSRFTSGTTCVPPRRIIHPAIVARPSPTPSRSNWLSWRYRGSHVREQSGRRQALREQLHRSRAASY